MINSKGDSAANLDTTTNRCWGFDSVNLGTFTGQAAFISRGSWRAGFLANGQEFGFKYRATGPGTAFSVVDTNEVAAFQVTHEGNMEIGTPASAGVRFIDFKSSGNVVDYDCRIQAASGNATAGNGTLALLAGVIETKGGFHVLLSAEPVYRIGNLAASSTPRIEFRSSGLNSTYDSRVYSSGGSASTGAGALFLDAAAILFNGTARASSDNTRSLGAGSFRWTEVFAATGVINTSDEREKQDIEALTAAELRVATALKGFIKKFRFKDAVQAKGDAARIHVGVIAQEVIAAFEAEGLDATSYGIICYDEWDEMPEQLDPEGNVVQPYLPAGNRYGVRYEELLAFIIAAL